MKKYFLLLCISALAFTACDEGELDIPQKGVIAVDDFYNTDEDAEAALTVVYYDTHQNFISIPDITGWNYGPYFGLTNYQADDIFLAGSGPEDCVGEREFHQFRYANDNIVPLGGYTAFYRSIHKCNLVINNFTAERLGTLSSTMQRVVAEARVMRAFDHMMLGIYWGTPPIVEEVLSGDSRPVNAESQDAVMQWVADQIDMALPYLDERESTGDYEGAVKITSGFANAVKGKALLWKGDYAGAKTALRAVINSGKYALLPSEEITAIGHADGKGSSESVFEFNAVFVPGVVEDVASRTGRNDIMTFNWRFENMHPMADDQIKSEGWGWINPTGEFCRALIANDGMGSARRKAWIKTYDEILYNHQWASDDVPFVPGRTAAKENDHLRGIKEGLHVYGNEGYFTWKNVIHADQGDWLKVGWAGQWNKNFSIMRYAEVLLMYAEACAMTTDDDGVGLQSLQAIQNRAQSNTVSSELTLAAVQKEKQFELWLEGTRSADVIRWGNTEVLEDQDHYVPRLVDEFEAEYDDEGEYVRTLVPHNGSVDESNAGYWVNQFGTSVGFKPGKHELLPFPRRVIELNTGLTQNPNWD